MESVRLLVRILQSPFGLLLPDMIHIKEPINKPAGHLTTIFAYPFYPLTRVHFFRRYLILSGLNCAGATRMRFLCPLEL